MQKSARTVPPSWLEIETEWDWIPMWHCPIAVFDRRAAQHLFFLRALHESKRALDLPRAPDVCRTEFPREHREILLARLYGDAA